MYDWRNMDEDELADIVEEWHFLDESLWDMLGQPKLHEYIGMTEEEYSFWTSNPVIDKKIAEE